MLHLFFPIPSCLHNISTTNRKTCCNLLGSNNCRFHFKSLYLRFNQDLWWYTAWLITTDNGKPSPLVYVRIASEILSVRKIFSSSSTHCFDAFWGHDSPYTFHLLSTWIPLRVLLFLRQFSIFSKRRQYVTFDAFDKWKRTFTCGVQYSPNRVKYLRLQYLNTQNEPRIFIPWRRSRRRKELSNKWATDFSNDPWASNQYLCFHTSTARGMKIQWNVQKKHNEFQWEIGNSCRISGRKATCT